MRFVKPESKITQENITYNFHEKRFFSFIDDIAIYKLSRRSLFFILLQINITGNQIYLLKCSLYYFLTFGIYIVIYIL